MNTPDAPRIKHTAGNDKNRSGIGHISGIAGISGISGINGLSSLNLVSNANANASSNANVQVNSNANASIAAAKTPFQASNNHLKSFRSEAQATRSKTGTRFYGSTKIPRKPVAEKTMFHDLQTRMGNIVKPALMTTTKAPLPSSNRSHLTCDAKTPKTHVPTTNRTNLPTINRSHLTCEAKTPKTHLPTTNRTHLTCEPKTPKTPNQMQRAHSEPTIKYQVKVNDKVYKVLRKIGSGGSAKVYEGFEPQTCQTAAIKIINMAKADPKSQESYFNEIELLKRLKNSQHVVQIHDSEYKAEVKELVIVMEKGDADLSQVIESHFSTRRGAIDGIFIKFYWREMVQAVNEIHQYGIVHADLKPVNFILVKNRIKLIDFGIASAVDPGGTSVIRDYQIGTINYMAPEALRNRATDENNSHIKTLIKYNSKVDIWSLGCILYNLVYGRPPFDKYQDILSKVQAITNPHQVIQFPPLNNEKLLSCMKSCLRYDSAKRLSAKELLEDPYLSEDMIVLRPQPQPQSQLQPQQCCDVVVNNTRQAGNGRDNQWWARSVYGRDT